MILRPKKTNSGAPTLPAMAKNRSSKATILLIFISFIAFCAFVIVPVFAPLPSIQSRHHAHHSHPKKVHRKFEIADDMFWKDGEPFRIIGGDLHYFRVHPEYWEDRLLKAKALGLNTIQTYVPWNLHEPTPGKLVFEGFADIESFLNLCHKLDLLVMVRPGPYICAEWDWGGFPSWLSSMNPSPIPRSSDPAFLKLVERWWGKLLPKLVPLLYDNGGPIIMVQVENEYGSYGDDKAYLQHLITLARGHLGHDAILYTTDGGSRENLEKGTIRGDSVFSAVDFTTGDDPWPIFKLQKEFNAPGKSPPLSTEFYTGWLTHWGEKNAKTDADSTAAALEEILRKNGSAVLYMAHGGSNFGFYNGANTGANEADYKPDLTSYDYDAPIREAGDVDNSKFNAIRRVIARYSSVPLPSIPSDNKKATYGPIHLQRQSSLFDMFDFTNSSNAIKSKNPMSMENVGQVENMGRVNYGPFIFDRKGILSSVYLDRNRLQGWRMFPIPLHNLNEVPNYNPIMQATYSAFSGISTSRKRLMNKSENTSKEPAFYSGHFFIGKSSQIKDTFLSFNNWGKGIVFVNDFNLGRYWPLKGPQCTLYVPAPVLKHGDNFLVILELESPDPKLVVHTVDEPDFTCGFNGMNIHRM
ncbi:variant 2, Beta-galactosidase 17 [Lathyrus oleraceus]|uniref:Beta-galactosidase n=1 Tax=Pisum sativum TaxID=3888 RepID=A0A9D4X505_PEA|nr:variant 2, Beta-galactosidase 17 [Pisum sativum]